MRGKPKDVYFPFPEASKSGYQIEDGEAVVHIGFEWHGADYHTVFSVRDARRLAEIIVQSAEGATAELMSAA